MTVKRPRDRYAGYRRWFYAAAVYNLLWGSLTILFPTGYFQLVGIEAPTYTWLWQVVGMFVLVYAPAYWWAARRPDRHWHFILIGLLGKSLGPLGYAWLLVSGTMPLEFGLTILTNDLIWWPAFILYLREVVATRGGILPLLRDEQSGQG